VEVSDGDAKDVTRELLMEGELFVKEILSPLGKKYVKRGSGGFWLEKEVREEGCGEPIGKIWEGAIKR